MIKLTNNAEPIFVISQHMGFSCGKAEQFAFHGGSCIIFTFIS